MIIYVNYIGAPGTAAYGSVERITDGLYRQANESFAAGPTYFAMPENLAASGSFRASVTGDSWADGLYMARVHDSGNAFKVVGGDMFNVQGGMEIPIGEANIYHADIQFTKNTPAGIDEYTVTWFKNGVPVTGGVTGPTLEIINRSDGTDLVGATPMVQIGTGASYKLDVIASSSRQVAGQSYLCLATATIDGSTRSFSWILGRDAS